MLIEVAVTHPPASDIETPQGQGDSRGATCRPDLPEQETVMSKEHSRRTVLTAVAGTAATVAAASPAVFPALAPGAEIPAAAAPPSEPLPSAVSLPDANADAELFKLIEEHRLAKQDEARLCQAFEPFEKAYFANPRTPRGYWAAQRAHKAAEERCYMLEDQVFATPARTPAGLAAKARMAIEETRGVYDYVGTILEYLARDAIALEGLTRVQ